MRAIYYFSVILSEKKRKNAPAVIKMKKVPSQRNSESYYSAFFINVKETLGLLRQCYKFSLIAASAPEKEILLPSSGHKYEEVADELDKAAYYTGLDIKNNIFMINTNSVRIRHRLSALYAMLTSLWVFFRIQRSKYLSLYKDVLFYTICLSKVLSKRSQKSVWVIIGDLSPFLIALSAACRLAGQKVAYWQYSYLDFKPLPVKADIAVILNRKGCELSRFNDAEEQKIYWRPRPGIEKLRLEDIVKRPIGAMLNVHADGRALQALVHASHALNQTISVRLHPNSSLGGHKWPDELVIAEPTETLEDFIERHSIALCGNTQAQAKALTLGLPVVHCPELDPLGFDHHGYVNSGIMPLCSSLKNFDIDNVKAFYAGVSYHSQLSKMMGPEPIQRVPGLDQFLKDVLN